MPQLGERKTKDGVTGEWDGQTWRQIEAQAHSDIPDPRSFEKTYDERGTAAELQPYLQKRADAEGTSGSGPEAAAMLAGGELLAPTVLAGAAAKIPGVAGRIMTAATSPKGLGLGGAIAGYNGHGSYGMSGIPGAVVGGVQGYMGGQLKQNANEYVVAQKSLADSAKRQAVLAELEAAKNASPIMEKAPEAWLGEIFRNSKATGKKVMETGERYVDSAVSHGSRIR